MRRWLVLPLAIGLAAIAAYALLSGPPLHVGSPPPERDPARARDARREQPADEDAAAPAPHAEIGKESRDRLREILREADREDR